MRTLLALSLLAPLAAQAKASGTIQSRLDRASSGDVIDVPAGTYRECLVVSKSGITLRGAGRDQTRVECDGRVLKVDHANELTVRGIAFVKIGQENENAAVLLDGGSGSLSGC